MRERLLAIAIERETDIVLARQRTRKIAALTGFDLQDQTRITTAVSEIARNTLDYGGGGRIEYWLIGDTSPQELEIIVKDEGRGIEDAEAVLQGVHQSKTGMGIGITGARRLMDKFDMRTARDQGTRICMGKALSRRAPFVAKRDIKALSTALSVQESIDPFAEISHQNREMIVQLAALHEHQQMLKQVNDELQDTNRGVIALYAELADRADHLRQADQLKSRFLSNMTHEFRTPLNSILALSRLLLSRIDGTLSAEQERQVHFIRKSAENLTDLVNDLLDIAKVEAGKTVVTPAEFSATELFSTLRGMLRPLLVGDAVVLIFEETDTIPPLLTDEGKVSQILRNFISNALKFTVSGEIRVSAKTDPVADTITFEVRDTGIGIAESDIETIWNEFGQIAHPLQSRQKGTGLGLPLSKKLAELLRGSVAVESAPGQGSVFSVTVPRLYRHRLETVEGAPTWQIEPGRLPVLAVEDDSADAFTLERTLAQTRYQLIRTANLAEATRALAHISPVAILLDVMLVGEESWRFLIEIKQRESTQNIPVIVISSTQEERKARNLGADDYLDKPTDAAKLLRALDGFTGEHTIVRTLIVDDDEVFRYLARQLLPRGAFELREATTVLDGLHFVENDPPDIVLLDLDLPVRDGFYFLEQLGEGGNEQTPPVIVVTAQKLADVDRRRLGRASRVLSKSDLTTDSLVSTIRDVIATAAPARL